MTKPIDASEIHVDVHNVTKYVTIDYGRGNFIDIDDIDGDGRHILVTDHTDGYRFTNNEHCTIAPLDNIRAVNLKAAQEAQRGYLTGIQTSEGLYQAFRAAINKGAVTLRQESNGPAQLLFKDSRGREQHVDVSRDGNGRVEGIRLFGISGHHRIYASFGDRTHLDPIQSGLNHFFGTSNMTEVARR